MSIQLLWVIIVRNHLLVPPPDIFLFSWNNAIIKTAFKLHVVWPDLQTGKNCFPWRSVSLGKWFLGLGFTLRMMDCCWVFSHQWNYFKKKCNLHRPRWAASSSAMRESFQPKAFQLKSFSLFKPPHEIFVCPLVTVRSVSCLFSIFIGDWKI